MALKTGKQYLERLQATKPEVYQYGQKVSDICDNAACVPGIGQVSLAYSLAQDPDPDICDLFCTHSDLIEDKASRYNYPMQTADDCAQRVKQTRTFAQRTIGCSVRCMGLDMVHSLWHFTWEIDRKRGTHYHDRFKEYVKWIQQEDLAVSGAIMDPKGDRMQPFPSQQKNPDAFLRVVEERKDGIVVRGAKQHQSGAIYVDEHLVMPCTATKEGDEAYAISFAVPRGAKGMKYVLASTVGEARRLFDRERGITWDHIGPYHAVATMIFDDVFVPWDRVFQYREVEYSAPIVNLMVDYHRMVSACCKSGNFDVCAGVAASLADAIGVARAPHVRAKILDIIRMAESSYAGILGAIYQGEKKPSGIWAPNTLLIAATWYNIKMYVSQVLAHVADIAGGLIVTQPSELDYKHPDLHEQLKSYLQGHPDVPTENRLRLLRLAENLISGPFQALVIHAAGTPEVNLGAIKRDSDVNKLKGFAKALAGIKD